MDTCTTDSCDVYEWQATHWTFLQNLRDKLHSGLNTPVISHQQAPRKFTDEATYMIYVIFFFVVLVVIGSSITVYGFLLNIFQKKQCSHDVGDDKDKATQMQPKKKAPGKPTRIGRLENCKIFFNCFCIQTNARKIFTTDSKEKTLNCIHGIRVLTMAWTIFLHTVEFYSMSTRDYGNTKSFMKTWYAQLILNGSFVTSNFFVLSGLLNGYLFSASYKKTRGNIPWIFFYASRFVRITPLYMIVLGFYTTLFSYVGSGPLWPSYNTNPVCKNNWWQNLFHINNFQSGLNECMHWTWHLAADTQIYVISPIFLVSLIRWKRLRYSLIGVGICGSCVAIFLIMIKYNLSDGFSRFGYYEADSDKFSIRVVEYFDQLYSMPYTWLGSYLIGMTVGHYLHEKAFSKGRASNTVTLYCGWIFTTIAMWIGFFALYNREESLIESALHNTVKHALFSCSLAWLIFICVTGQGGTINRFLSSKYFFLLSRLTFVASLINPIVIMAYFQSVEEQDDYFSVISLVILYFRVYLWTLFVSFFVTLTFEFPMSRLLQNLLLSKGHKD